MVTLLSPPECSLQLQKPLNLSARPSQGHAAVHTEQSADRNIVTQRVLQVAMHGQRLPAASVNPLLICNKGHTGSQKQV